MIPQKLKPGDEIRVIAPSRSLALISKDVRAIALDRLRDLGFKVTYGKNVEEKDEFISSSIKSRLEDLHEAYADKKVRAILTSIGGFNSNQLLKYIDYDLIKKNPKILCGYSDITALHNAIYAKTGVASYYGPHFSSFGMKKGLEYTQDYFRKCLLESEPFEIKASKEWSNDEWYADQEKRKFIKNKGYLVINPGKAEGKIIGGNLCTFNLLQGTEFRPDLKDSILFLEDDSESKPVTFDRDLQSIIHLPDFYKVRGIVIGRFEKSSNMTDDLLTKIIRTKKELENIPVIANVDFGHTTPMATFPIGGKANIFADKKKAEIEITEH